MATPTSISAFIAASTAQGLTFAQIRDALKYAFVAGISDDGRLVTAVAADGSSVAVMTVDACVRAIAAMHQLALGDIGPASLAPQFSSFDSGSYGGN